jgi:Uma2 family endonuclease
MSTVERPRPAVVPPLVAGERLDQPGSHRRYGAMPPGARAEWIGGVVHRPSPVSIEHGEAHVPAIVWLSYYAENTPGVRVLDNATVILGWKSEPQPDVMLRVRPEHGGRTRNQGPYVAGTPELVVEVARATRFVDLGPKLADCEQAGVLEYVVRALEPDELIWHRQDGGRLVRVPPDPDGLHRSAAFPGLWLDPGALLRGETRRLREALDLGLATPEHRDWRARLGAPGPP